MEKKDADKQVYRRYFDRSEFMFPRKLFNPKEYIKSICPCLTRCCKPDRLEKGFMMGRIELQKETNIIEIIKSRRYFNGALKILLTKH